jgi:hypothetical protein
VVQPGPLTDTSLGGALKIVWGTSKRNPCGVMGPVVTEAFGGSTHASGSMFIPAITYSYHTDIPLRCQRTVGPWYWNLKLLGPSGPKYSRQKRWSSPSSSLGPNGPPDGPRDGPPVS